ncbi:hypothetical protein CW751_11595 [Brumimicrobium salinarum]|uniref:TraB/GumN family protein n=1 Tax=Brumimicrobium salinarum TaxID=2058658 RepID=A0A2I0R0P8_9FLAO|nr:TraB/GumN family protein [Brumimicrobium salinarum]PKR80139.1 hypothetical protein CW751_11595 [Brumimicrobium salinarum]
MKNFYLLLTSFIFVISSGIAQDSLSTSLLWEITGKKVKQPSYIFGTMHLIPEDDFLFPESLQNKVKESDLLVMEIGGITEQMKAMHLMMLDSGSMFDYFTEPQLDSLFAYTDAELGYDEKQMRTMFSKMKPFVLLQLFTKEAFGTNPQSYEMSLQKIAQKNDLEIIGLETVEEQMSFIDNLSQEDQVNMIMESIRSEDIDFSETKELIEIYLSQDINAIHKYTVSASISSPEFEASFLNERNKNWIAPIKKLIKKNKTFIAVGAAHLGGPKGVVELLRNEGYTLTPIKL